MNIGFSHDFSDLILFEWLYLGTSYLRILLSCLHVLLYSRTLVDIELFEIFNVVVLWYVLRSLEDCYIVEGEGFKLSRMISCSHIFCIRSLCL